MLKKTGRQVKQAWWFTFLQQSQSREVSLKMCRDWAGNPAFRVLV